MKKKYILSIFLRNNLIMCNIWTLHNTLVAEETLGVDTAWGSGRGGV